MTRSHTVRAATEEDAAAIARLAAELGYETAESVMRERVRAMTNSPTDLLLVATDSTGVPVAWLQAHAAQIVESGFRVEIVGLIVADSARRRGVGRALVGEAEKWAAGLGAQAIVVRSNTRRLESHIFYPALGFAQTKTQHVYRKPLLKAPA